jgi:GntR family transcriptional repressor for pyruvate dehydrogenase complex
MEPIKRVDVASQVAEKIKSYIQDEGLAYGLKLPPERLMCDELEVSRTSLREGYRLLQAQGFLEIKSGKGAFVSSPMVAADNKAFFKWISEQTVSYHDLIMVRKVLENLAITLAVELITDEQRNRLSENVSMTEKLVGQSENYKILAELDEEFHHIIFEASHNTFLIEINNYMEKRLLIFRYSLMQLPKNQLHTLEPHKAILECLQNHDNSQCIIEMSKHLELADSDMRKIVKQ